METIFDHNITEDELTFLFGHVVDKERYLSLTADIDTDSANGMLYSLYTIRNDNVTALKYLNKIKDKQYKFDLQLDDIIEESFSQQ